MTLHITIINTYITLPLNNNNIEKILSAALLREQEVPKWEQNIYATTCIKTKLKYIMIGVGLEKAKY